MIYYIVEINDVFDIKQFRILECEQKLFLKLKAVSGRDIKGHFFPIKTVKGLL